MSPSPRTVKSPSRTQPPLPSPPRPAESPTLFPQRSCRAFKSRHGCSRACAGRGRGRGYRSMGRKQKYISCLYPHFPRYHLSGSSGLGPLPVSSEREAVRGAGRCTAPTLLRFWCLHFEAAVHTYTHTGYALFITMTLPKSNAKLRRCGAPPPADPALGVPTSSAAHPQ